MTTFLLHAFGRILEDVARQQGRPRDPDLLTAGTSLSLQTLPRLAELVVSTRAAAAFASLLTSPFYQRVNMACAAVAEALHEDGAGYEQLLDQMVPPIVLAIHDGDERDWERRVEQAQLLRLITRRLRPGSPELHFAGMPPTIDDFAQKRCVKYHYGSNIVGFSLDLITGKEDLIPRLFKALDADTPESQAARWATLEEAFRTSNLKGSKCSMCGIEVEELKRCARCHGAEYCSAACQKKDWPEHKKAYTSEQHLSDPLFSPALPDELLERVLYFLNPEDLRSCSLVSRRFLLATNAVRTSVRLDECAGKKVLLRLAKRFSATTSLRFGSSKYVPHDSWLQKGLHQAVRSFPRLQSLDLSELAPEVFSSFEALNPVLKNLPHLTSLTLKLPQGLIGMDQSEHIAQAVSSASKHCPKLEELDIRPGSSALFLAREPEVNLIKAYGELLQGCPELKFLTPIVLTSAGAFGSLLGKVLEVRGNLLSLTLCGDSGGSPFIQHDPSPELCQALDVLSYFGSLQHLTIKPQYTGRCVDRFDELQTAIQTFAESTVCDLRSLRLIGLPISEDTMDVLLSRFAELRELWLAPVLSPAYETIVDQEKESEARLKGLARDAIGHAPARASESVEKLVWELNIGLEDRVSRLVSLDALVQSFPSLKELRVRTVPPKRPDSTFGSKERQWSVVRYGFGDVTAPTLTSLQVTHCELGSLKSLGTFCPNLVSLRLCNSFFGAEENQTTKGACFFPHLERLYLVRDRIDPFLDWFQMVPPGFGPVHTVSHVEISTHYLESIEFLTSFPRLYVLRIRFLNIDYEWTGHWRPLLKLWEVCKSLRYVYLEGPEAESFRNLVTEMRASCPPHVELGCKEAVPRFATDE
ncbi:hypothetical protein KFL_001990120 [Klebsormidium nitens]|uniref:MYND-type domain-containing protein n=1 Tax=Klebsormidium nitens TaxID=105231 RepID=A0A1Y1I5G5_KLENI|nr:hypothetical protein KFL_001990120 [Klebsormidium nitens]|eukprot:GAQ84659.1 hypothetical protein KFL_001990120 [Klebsormidium nitens]